jgi:hypothetical protein
MFYSTNQSYHWKLNQSEVDISGRLANQIVRIDFIFIMRVLFSLCASYNLIIFYELALLLVICLFPAILFSLCASYNLIIFYELPLSLVISPFPVILFS